MCERGVFPIFSENDVFKVDKILGLTFSRQENTWKNSKRRFSIYCRWVLCSMDCLRIPFIRVEEPFRELSVPNKKIWPKNRSLFLTNKFENKCLQKFFVSSNYNVLPQVTEPPFLLTTQQTLLAITWRVNRKQQSSTFLLRLGNNSNFSRFHQAITLLFAKW